MPGKCEERQSRKLPNPAFAGVERSGGLSSPSLMHLIEILLPLSDNEGQPFAPELRAQVRDELVEHFGGVTAFTRSPAEGLWDEGKGDPDRDEIIIFERSEEHTSELQSQSNLVCRLLLEKKKEPAEQPVPRKVEH